jgi:enamine deaminase RidA (YjgF/YER057c/UK114 family)
MEKPEFFVTPGYGEYLLNKLHYSQAIKIGNRVETSGQGGWDIAFNPPLTVRLLSYISRRSSFNS